MWHARKTTTLCTGARHSLHCLSTREWCLSGTVIFASIASSRKCKKCRGSHHSWLHKHWTKKPSRSWQPSQSSGTQEDPTFVTMHTSQLGHQQQVLLMTCQAIVVGPDSTSYKARALLDSGSSASFILERVVQHLCLPHGRQDSKVSRIGGGTMHLSSQVSVNFTE